MSDELCGATNGPNLACQRPAGHYNDHRAIDRTGERVRVIGWSDGLLSVLAGIQETGAVTDPRDVLSALREDVERMRDQMQTVVETYRNSGTREAINNRMTARAEAAAYDRVLDLIDKHREGQ